MKADYEIDDAAANSWWGSIDESRPQSLLALYAQAHKAGRACERKKMDEKLYEVLCRGRCSFSPAEVFGGSGPIGTAFAVEEIVRERDTAISRAEKAEAALRELLPHVEILDERGHTGSCSPMTDCDCLCADYASGMEALTKARALIKKDETDE